MKKRNFKSIMHVIYFNNFKSEYEKMSVSLAGKQLSKP